MGAELGIELSHLTVSFSGTLTLLAHLSPGMERGEGVCAMCPLCARASLVSMNLVHCQPCKADATRLVKSELKVGLIQRV